MYVMKIFERNSIHNRVFGEPQLKQYGRFYVEVLKQNFCNCLRQESFSSPFHDRVKKVSFQLIAWLGLQKQCRQNNNNNL
jgi:hypothetical protein